MQRSLRGVLAAAAIVSLAALGSAPANSAQRMPLALGESPIVDVQFNGPHGDTHNAFREEHREGIGRFSPYRRYHNRNRHFRNFYFGFPFGFAPPYYAYHRQRPRNCFRTWDGQLFCRVY